MAIYQGRGALGPNIDPQSMVIDWAGALNQGLQSYQAVSAIKEKQTRLKLAEKELAHKQIMDDKELELKDRELNSMLAYREVQTKVQEAQIEHMKLSDVGLGLSNKEMSIELEQKDQALDFLRNPANNISTADSNEEIMSKYVAAGGNKYIIDELDRQVERVHGLEKFKQWKLENPERVAALKGQANISKAELDAEQIKFDAEIFMGTKDNRQKLAMLNSARDLVDAGIAGRQQEMVVNALNDLGKYLKEEEAFALTPEEDVRMQEFDAITKAFPSVRSSSLIEKRLLWSEAGEEGWVAHRLTEEAQDYIDSLDVSGDQKKKMRKDISAVKMALLRDDPSNLSDKDPDAKKLYNAMKTLITKVNSSSDEDEIDLSVRNFYSDFLDTKYGSSKTFTDREREYLKLKYMQDRAAKKVSSAMSQYSGVSVSPSVPRESSFGTGTAGSLSGMSNEELLNQLK